MKAIMLSIKPKYCELIASGKKTIEVRKTVPKLETPFKCYIYCTSVKNMPLSDYVEIHRATGGMVDDWHGKVIGEFVCRGIMRPNDSLKLMAKQSCLSEEELHKYSGGKTLYGLRIADLKIYDKPKELGEFFTKGECQREFCAGCKNFHRGEGWLDGSYCDEDSCIEYGIKPLTRPPQSWCYCEEL